MFTIIAICKIVGMGNSQVVVVRWCLTSVSGVSEDSTMDMNAHIQNPCISKKSLNFKNSGELWRTFKDFLLMLLCMHDVLLAHWWCLYHLSSILLLCSPPWSSSVSFQGTDDMLDDIFSFLIRGEMWNWLIMVRHWCVVHGFCHTFQRVPYLFTISHS